MNKLINICKTFGRFCGPKYEIYDNLKEVVIYEHSLFGNRFVHYFYLLKNYNVRRVEGSEYARVTGNKRRDDIKFDSQLKVGKVFINWLVRKNTS